MIKFTTEEKVKSLELINAKMDKWAIRALMKQDGEMYHYNEERITKKPSLNYIKPMVLGWYNQQTDKKILSGFTWNDYPVWLSTENQFNYKAEYDLAVQTGGATLPAKFKFGTTDAPQYHIFETVEELTDFYIKVVQYIRECLDEGYAKKDAINWEEYEV